MLNSLSPKRGLINVTQRTSLFHQWWASCGCQLYFYIPFIAYPRLSIHGIPFFSLFPIAPFYKKAMKAIVKLKTIKTPIKDDYGVIFGSIKKEYGIIGKTDIGFNQLVESLIVTKVINQKIDEITLETHTNTISNKTDQYIKFILNGSNIEIPSQITMESLENAVRNFAQHSITKFLLWLAFIALILAIISFILGIRLSR